MAVQPEVGLSGGRQFIPTFALQQAQSSERLGHAGWRLKTSWSVALQGNGLPQLRLHEVGRFTRSERKAPTRSGIPFASLDVHNELMFNPIDELIYPPSMAYDWKHAS
jgi:hypothetical protein